MGDYTYGLTRLHCVCTWALMAGTEVESSREVTRWHSDSTETGGDMSLWELRYLSQL